MGRKSHQLVLDKELLEMLASLKILCAYILDRLIGDPRWIPHPVVGMGKAISQLEQWLNRFVKQNDWRNETHRWPLRILGMLFPLLIAGGVFVISYYLIAWLYAWNEWLGWTVEVILIATTIATKGLAEAGEAIYRALRSGDLRQARYALSMVVGRDTDDLDEPEIVRGGVETIAENIVDAVSSPLFYAFLGGAPLALAYRAVNTLDSMVGYRNERYLHLGWASARLDDIANWLPARLTIVPMLLALAVLRLDYRFAWRVMQRDAHRHPSPNSGIPEAIMAGGLHIQLGGVNKYQGRVSRRAQLGEPLEMRKDEHLLSAIRVLYWTTMFYVGIITLICFII
jgi:adenosylcobinamide-phosphate synthase